MGRRALVTAILVSVLQSTSIATAAPSVNGSEDAGQAAFADWILKTGSHTGTWFFAEAESSSGTDGRQTWGVIGRGGCVFFSAGDYVCGAPYAPKQLSTNQFSVDPLMASARLEYPRGHGRTTAVTWRATQLVAPRGYAEGFVGAAFAGIDAYRKAAARGTLCRRRLT